MGKKIELTGKTFERLSVIKEVPATTKSKQIHWLCTCSCGNSVTVVSYDLRHKHTKSCGCLQQETRTKHAKWYTPEYKVWAAIIQRCTNKNNPGYKNYGGRGISVDITWRDSFENFYTDMGNKPNASLTIERLDNNKNYCKNNCIWAPRKDQARNKRDNINITYKGKTQCLMDWAIELKIPHNTLYSRHRRGVLIPDLLSKSKILH